MKKKMRSIQSGVVFDYNPAWEKYPDIYELIEVNDKPHSAPRRKSRAKPKSEPVVAVVSDDMFGEIDDLDNT